MKKLILAVLIMAVMVFSVAVVFADSHGPAPNSGDGVPDGSGFESPNGPNCSGPGDSENGHFGPAPNSGDGIPDGSGFDFPNGPNN